MMMGEKDNERREMKVRTRFWIWWTCRFAAEWGLRLRVERENARVGDDDLFFVEDSTGCPALDTAQGADAGLFDIPVIFDQNGHRTVVRILRPNALKVL